MSIKSVKIEMVKASGNVADADKQGKVEYKPMATITYNEEEKTTKQIFLDNKLVDKNYFKCWDVGQSFLSGLLMILILYMMKTEIEQQV